MTSGTSSLSHGLSQMATSPPSDDNLAFSTTPPKNAFFVRRAINLSKKKIKPLMFTAFMYADGKELDGDTFSGSWSNFIIDHRGTSYILTGNTDAVTGSTDQPVTSMQTKLVGVIETLKWITDGLPEDYLSHVELNLFSDDIFIVNTLKEWIPKWYKENFKISKLDATKERPCADLLREIAEITMNVKLTIKWTSPVSNEYLIAAKNKVSEENNRPCQEENNDTVHPDQDDTPDDQIPDDTDI